MKERNSAMTINLRVPDLTELKPRITVFGVGGAGGNAVNNMIERGLKGVEFVVANTDAQALASSSAERRIQMGANVTEGLGAGSKPEVGAAAAEEAMADIKAHLVGCHMVFITAGMGGGTGTGAAPVIARASREEGILTVGVVTKPFQFEGSRRFAPPRPASTSCRNSSIRCSSSRTRTCSASPTRRPPSPTPSAMADDVLRAGVACITDLMVKEGLINLDFADVRTIMAGMGKAMMGTGELSGERRAIEAAEAAIANPLLDDVCMKGASGLLVSITGGNDLTLYEVDEAASRVRAEADPDANIIVGATFDDELDGSIRVSVVATGIGLAASRAARGYRGAAARRDARPVATYRAPCRTCRASLWWPCRSRRAESRAGPERGRQGRSGVARPRQCDDREASGADGRNGFAARRRPEAGAGGAGAAFPARASGCRAAPRATHAECR